MRLRDLALYACLLQTGNGDESFECSRDRQLLVSGNRSHGEHDDLNNTESFLLLSLRQLE